MLILASAVLSTAGLVPGIRVPPANEPEVPLLISFTVVAVLAAVTIWLVVKLYRRKNWARTGMLVFLLLGWWSAGGELTGDFLRSPVYGFINMICIAMEAAALGYLFFGAGAKWFAKR